jgi:hypothetical protein
MRPTTGDGEGLGRLGDHEQPNPMKNSLMKRNEVFGESATGDRPFDLGTGRADDLVQGGPLR